MLIRMLRRDEQGSLPLALLVAIVAAGIVTALAARVVQGERTVRFDQSFSENLPPADSGVNQALFQLNAGLRPGGTPLTFTDTIDGATVQVSVTADGSSPRIYTAESVSTRDDVTRTVIATIEEELRFFPGAFGDILVNPRGASTVIDSYNPDCDSSNGPNCGWGDDRTHGTRRGSIGTNNLMELPGQIQFFPGNAFLYDYDANPPSTGSISGGDPFGDRCDGVKCTEDNVTPIGPPVPVEDAPLFQKTLSMFADGGGCFDTSSNRYFQHRDPNNGDPDWNLEVVGNGNRATHPLPLQSWLDTQGGGYTAGDQSDPLEGDFENYYCAENLNWLANIDLDPSVTVENPLVVFVKDSVRTAKGVNTACEDGDSETKCIERPSDVPPSAADPNLNILPQSQRLQVYVAGIPSATARGGVAGGQISLGSGSTFAGILYGPTSSCSTTNSNARVDVYGSMTCGEIDNAGNWQFHYDGALDDLGTGRLSIARWSEQ